ncbi:uncharacterized protein LOC109087234 isoform X2 [Cyprinus carpio]|uniref:Uncharacterized protein LOC109087234 isoform X2 n=1 Tax=Cyprinus carpio TaxID=7962 RepID=A0A9Q9W7N2_CYPCA|nr:uncharacterized protein LOC109087234 isoform X2 [Cyprinus carpio]
MNWVGGSRSRYMKSKEDTTKQRAFFQKQRMKRKSNTEESPKGYNPDNMDLLTLFIVNQISSKKEQTEKPKTNLLTGVKRSKRALKEPSELPMSPCSPSNLNLVTSQPQYCIDTPGYKVRKHRLSEEFKFTPVRMTKMLSPLLESNLSDASGSENQPQPPSTSSGSSDPTQPKPAQHLSSSLPTLENLSSMKKTPQFVSFSKPTKLANPWPNEALLQDVSHNSSAAGNQFESTLPKICCSPERGEHSEASGSYPLNPLKSTEEPEEPLFIDFKNLDYKVIDSMNPCDRSQNMDSNGHLSTQGFVCTDSNTCADGSSVFVHVGKSPRGVHLSSDDTEAQRCDGTLPITLETGTQTGALSYRDVSVQCSLIHHPFPSAKKTSAFTTRWQYSNFNQLLNPTTHTSPKNGHKKTGNMPSGASATNQQVQRHPKSQMGFSFRKLHSQKSMKRDLTSASKHPFCNASEQKKEESRKKIEKCDYPRLGNVTRNPVKDVSHAGEFMKEMKRCRTSQQRKV